MEIRLPKITIIIAVALISCTSCAPQVYIQVQEPAFPIPDGSTAFTCSIPMDQILTALKKNTIAYTKNEIGYVTESFNIDDGTVARFNIYENDGTIKVVPYWGITDKVRNQIAFATGMGGASNIVGAKCNDGTRSNSTGSGTCSSHGGVKYWICK